MAVSKIGPTGLSSNVAQLGTNLIINGEFVVNQRGTATSPANNVYGGPDRWKNFQTTGGAVTISQDVTGIFAAGGTDTALKIDVTTVDSSIAAGDRFVIVQAIEAQNLQNLNYGQATAKELTLSFWYRSPKSGTHYVALYQGDGNRYAWRAFTVTSADTAQYFSLTFAGDTGGTINNDTGVGMHVYFPLMAGSNFEGGSDNTWAANELYGAATIQNLLDNTSNNIYIGLVQLEIGNTASDFEHEPISVTLAKCQRYFERLDFSFTNGEPIGYGVAASTSSFIAGVPFRVAKRAAPTLASSAAATFDVLYAGGAVAEVGAINSLTSGQYHLQFVGTSVSGSPLTDGASIILRRDATDTTFITISAEL